jgi:glycosyltransferase 2 family protein
VIRWAALLGLAGLALATALFVWQGAGAILAAFLAAGLGIVWSSAFHLVPMALNARAWQVLLPRGLRPSAAFFLRAVWLREAVNGLLPVARIGGEVASARLVMNEGLRAPLAVASLVVDMTLSLVSQFIFAVLGLVLLSFAGGGGAFERRLALGLLAAVPILLALGLVQRFGFFGLLARFVRALFGDRFERLVGGAAPLDRAARRLYRRRTAILASMLWQLAGWIAGAGELFIALLFLDAPRSVVDVLILESLIQALSSGAFVVPGALGVQEGGFLVLGGFVGLAPELALALALMRRARDLLLFVPALVLWQLTLGRRLLRGRGRGAPGER